MKRAASTEPGLASIDISRFGVVCQSVVAALITALPLLLAHVPPVGVEFNVVVKPTQTVPPPVIVVGFGLTVTMVVIEQPAPNI